MQRRKFITRGVLGGAALIALRGDTEFNPLVLQPARAQDKSAAENLVEADIETLQKRVANGDLTYRKITEIYLARIAEIDRSGAALNSVLEVNPEASEIAEKLDRERQSRGLRSPLHGIPLLLKDNIDTADKMETTAGSLALIGAKRARDAFIAERLRVAGAVILGKTNLSEWANFRSSNSPSGWSGRGGQTRNPYDLTRNPCGSSSGTGAAVAANLSVVGIGTETDGSIVCPSNANCLVGIKPTVGLVSRSGIIPISASQDTAGPMTRTVRDAAHVLNAVAGYDATDTAMKISRGKSGTTNYTAFLDADGLRGMRLGIVRKLFGFNPAVDEQLNAELAEMKRRGAIIVDPVVVPTLNQFNDSELEVLLYEFKDGLNRYLASLVASPVRTLKDLIEFNEKNKAREMPYFGQDLFLKAEAKGGLNAPQYLVAKRKNNLLARVRGIDAVMSQHKLDALVAPTGSPAWTTDLINGDHYVGGSSTLAAVAGYPAITVPAGFIGELPVGISFFGRAFSEGTLIKIAYGYEQATKHRRAPEFQIKIP